MRLIDIDQKIYVPINDEAAGTSYEMEMTVAEMFDKFMDGYCPEIVDAIPVEWLKNNVTEYIEDWGIEAITVVTAIARWRKEQEAR